LLETLFPSSQTHRRYRLIFVPLGNGELLARNLKPKLSAGLG